MLLRNDKERNTAVTERKSKSPNPKTDCPQVEFPQTLQSVHFLAHLQTIYTVESLFSLRPTPLSKQDVCVSVGLPVQSWWSDSVAVEWPVLPALWQINWDLGLPFGFPTKATHREGQQNRGGHVAGSMLPLGRVGRSVGPPVLSFISNCLSASQALYRNRIVVWDDWIDKEWVLWVSHCLSTGHNYWCAYAPSVTQEEPSLKAVLYGA